jgi:tetratricopeptide (TPR) repeat protein
MCYALRIMLRQLGVVLSLVLFTASDASGHPGLSVDLAAVNRKLVERPGDVDLLLARATIYRRKGQLQSALADLGRVAQLAPQRRELFLERGLTQAALGRSAAAELDLTRYLDSGAPASAALMARGAIREASKRWALARVDFDAAIKLNPDAESYLARGRADETLGELDRAAAGYEEGLTALSGAVVIRLALIRVESARGHHDRALALIDEVLRWRR